MCWQCDNGATTTADRARVVQLLRLVEHPEALPAPAALRIAQELLALTRANTLRCEAVAQEPWLYPPED